MEVNYIKPEIGQTYTLRSGGEYRCLWVSDAGKVKLGECSAVLIRDKDGWKLTAHGIRQNEDGTIEWDYSTGGHWTSGPVKGDGKRFEVCNFEFTNDKVYCRACNGVVGWKNDGRYLLSSNSEGDENKGICHDCLIEHCCNTNCLGCDWYNYPDCPHVETKKIYMEREE